jgi:hypothetical protein
VQPVDEQHSNQSVNVSETVLSCWSSVNGNPISVQQILG